MVGDHSKPGVETRFQCLWGGLIPIRVLRKNREMRETHHGRHAFFVVSQFIEPLAEHFDQGIK
jgi:hypothetical protein